jgi:hypothetical protein
LRDSGGLITSEGLAPCFSGADLAAHDIFKPRKREMTRQIKIVISNFGFMGPPKYKKLLPHLMARMGVILLKFKKNLNSWDFERG